MKDINRVAAAQMWAEEISKFLGGRGFSVDTPFQSGNVDGGWIVEAVTGHPKDNGHLTLNIEIVPGPWEDDGTFE